MFTEFNQRYLEESRCLLIEEKAKEHCEKATKSNKSVCWYDVCVDTLFWMCLGPQHLEMNCRDYQWTEEDSLKLKNGNYFSPMFLYMGYLQMFRYSHNEIDLKIREKSYFESERRDLGYSHYCYEIYMKKCTCGNPQKVFLITTVKEEIVNIEEKDVDEKWCSCDGAYSELVPFTVGSNQYLIDMETYLGNKEFYDAVKEKYDAAFDEILDDHLFGE